MSLIAVFLIALSLALDCFAVSISGGMTTRSLKIRDAFKIALVFGLFHIIMPLLGWWSGSEIRDLVMSIDHWIAFGLLTFIGGKMIHESLEKGVIPGNPFKFPTLIMLSVATSIDALIIGITFALLKTTILIPALIMGGMTFALSFGGVFIGKRFGHIFEKKAEIIGGLVLIGIGIKALLER